MKLRAWSLGLCLLAAVGCGGSGGGGSVDLELAPGERAEDLLLIATDVDGGELLSCDLAVLPPSNPDNERAAVALQVDLGALTASGSRGCALRIAVTARQDARPDDYRVVVKLFYTYRGAFGIEADTVNGTIRVTVRG